MPVGFSDLEKLFQVVNLLENETELIIKFKPELLKLIVNKQFFTGHFRRAYIDAFDDKVISLIKSEVIGHFPEFTGEDVIGICDKEFLKMIVPKMFDQESYTQEA